MDLIAKRLEKEHPVYNTGIGIALVPLAEQLTSGVKPTLLVLTVGVGLVLLIGCVNIANLMLARGATRQREMAVRTALGARRSQLVWQLLVESWVLSAVAGALGFCLATWGASLLNTFVPDELGHIGGVAVTWRPFFFCFLLSTSSALAFGAVPAFHGSRLELNTSMAKSTRTVAASRSRAQATLLLSEVSLSVMLLVGSALMIRSYVNLLKVDLGFQQGDVLTLRVVPPASKYGALPARATFYERVLKNIRSLPGVIAAGMTSFLPLSLQGGTEGIAIEGQRVANDHLPAPSYRVVTPDYFRTLGIPLRKGRWLQASDNERAPLAAVINQKLARRYWPNEDALGKRFRIDDPRQTTPWITVIGVVGDVRQWAVDQEPRPELYIPYRQRPEYGYRPQDLVIRTTSDPMRLVPAVRRAIWDIDPDQPIGDIATMEQVLASELAPRRLQTILLSLFAVGAFALAALGVYGVISYTVAQRTREVGIRIALGASRTNVTGLFVRRGVLLIAAATLIGILASFAIWRVLRTFLFAVSPADLTSLVGVTMLVGTAALLAHYVPARRASRLDPMITLREE